MTIKEAAKLTGLTAKTIRYYEKMGLLHVSRDKDNSYRNYSEEDVLLLKKIKLFRYLEFSVSEIKDILKMNDAEISVLLSVHVESLQKRSEKLQAKKDLCISLSKDLRKSPMDLDEYGDILEYYEDEEIQSIINEISTPSAPDRSSCLDCHCHIDLVLHKLLGLAQEQGLCVKAKNQKGQTGDEKDPSRHISGSCYRDSFRNRPALFG